MRRGGNDISFVRVPLINATPASATRSSTPDGAIAEVLAEQGLTNRVVLLGGDGAYHSIAMIRSGALAGTVLQDSTRMGAATLEYIVQVLHGAAAVADLPRRSLFHVPDGPPVSALDVPYTWIDATNLSALEDYWKRQA